MSWTQKLRGGALLVALCLASSCAEDDAVPASGDVGEDVDPAVDAADEEASPDLVEADLSGPDLDLGEPDQGPDMEAPPRSCTQDADCDDGLGCTEDRCGGEGSCQWSLREDQCLINGRCFAAGQASPQDPCMACNPLRPFGWVGRAEGAACDDQSACTVGETCRRGECQGEALRCGDQNPCTAERCDPLRGCVAEPLPEGSACDDGDPCTVGDACVGGACAAGAPLACDDDNPCTDDACVDGACAQTPNAASCDDGDPCTEGDACADGACQAGGAANCDDGNFCTIDGCDALAGCYHLPTESPCCLGQVSVCDDGDPCTTDGCDPVTGACLRTQNAARCDDRSACTTNDTCQAGACVGRPVVCQDNNACTQDTCQDSRGCVFTALDGAPCDDGAACTTGDVCLRGVCAGDDAACVCEPTFGEAAARFTALALGGPGQALDLDRDGDLDNALGVLGGVINGPLQESVQSGGLTLLLDFRGFASNPFSLAVFDGDLAAADAGCDLQAEICDYEISESLLDPDTCAPRVQLSASLAGDNLVAGGAGTIFPFEIPFGDAPLSLTLYEARIEGTIATQRDGLASLSGVLGGAVRKEELLAAINALPPGSLPFPPDAISSLLDLLVVNDIDLDGDRTPDAASIAIAFDGIGARLVGVRR